MAAQLHPSTRAVFFDAVGTLLFPNPSALVVYADVARTMGMELSSGEVRTRFLTAFRKQEAADRVTGWVTSEERERERWRVIVHETLQGVPNPDACFAELYDHFAKPTAWQVCPHAAAVLKELNTRGLVVGMGSNYDARLWSVLDGFPELAPLRDRTVVSAAVGFRKPAAEFFREVTRVAGCVPGEILFAGDDIDNDYQGATAAGLNAVLLDDQHREPGITNRITSLRELVG
ncbi:MAG: haloacid dehalogenase [Planctomycetaceae bacterium]|nr:haloacid dehalogenase [Planctomycetaceae bacterium]